MSYYIQIVQPNISGLRETADRTAIFLEELPRHVSQERQALLKAIDDKASTIHTVNTDIQATFKQADVMLQGLQQTVAGADTLIASTETLIGRLEPYVSPETVTIDDYFKAIETVGDIVAGSNRLVLAVDQTGVPLISTMLEQFNRSAEARVGHIFSRLLILIVLMGGIGLVLLIVHGMLKGRSK